jgi:BASS family bile acid:Na+ symporter
MLNVIVSYGVPAGLFALMLIAGTEITVADFARVAKHPRAVVIGTLGQFVVLPPLGLLLTAATAAGSFVSTSILLLSLCPGGAISNSYSYLARCNVSLSATITAAGTLLCLAGIPLWLEIMSGSTALSGLPDVPASRILLQLAIFMVLPMALGMVLLRMRSRFVARYRRTLRWTSLMLVLTILVATAWAVREDMAALARDIVLPATLFILGGMLLGRVLARGMKSEDAPVLVVESAVRNVGVALIIGRSLFDDVSFGRFATFLTGYFLIEIVIMVPYAHFVRTRLERHLAVPAVG